MKLNIFITFVILVAIASVFSNSNVIAKSDESTNNTQNQVSDFDTTRHVTSEYNLTFPISQNPRMLGMHHHATMICQLQSSIVDYKRVTGYLPESLSAYIESGFPLFWQRNLMNGLPMEILTSRDVKNDPSDFGVVKWEKRDGDYALLISSNIDTMKYKDTGEVSWKIDKDPVRIVGTKRVTTVVGGTAPINEVSDPEARMLYAMCDQLHSFIFSNTDNYYSRNKRIPGSFVELLTFQQELGGTPLIIKENFDKFAQKLNDANADFQIGFDYSNNLSYAFLKIDGEILISHCYKYDNNVDNPNYNSMSEDDSPGIHVGCLMDEIDMSSPMISTSNVSSLDIPNEFLISVKDIPVV